HEVVAGQVEEGPCEEVEDRIRRQGTQVADHAGGGEPVLGGQHSIEVRQAATFRRCSRSEEEGDRLQVRVADSRRVHGGQTAANANGGRGSRTPGMQSSNSSTAVSVIPSLMVGDLRIEPLSRVGPGGVRIVTSPW